MKLSHRSDYAIKAILYLSDCYESRNIIPLTDISRSWNIPLKFLEQIMLILKGAGYVESKRGKGGGFFLVRPPELISLGEIVRLTKGSLEMNNPWVDRGTEDEHDEEGIVVSEVWAEVNEAVANIVDNVSFRDLLVRTKALREQKMGYTYEI